MQLLHEQQSETACGIVELNLTMVNTMVGALTTYLIILIQFDANARSANTVKFNMTNMTNSTCL